MVVENLSVFQFKLFGMIWINTASGRIELIHDPFLLLPRLMCCTPELFKLSILRYNRALKIFKAFIKV